MFDSQPYTGPRPGCDMTHHNISYKDGNVVCVQLAPPHSHASLASAKAAAVINASILVVLFHCWARPSPT